MQDIQELHQLRSNLEEPPEKKKKSLRIWIVVGIATVLLICIGSFIAVITPQHVPVLITPFTTKNMDLTTTKLTTVKFTGEPPQLPAQLPLAKASGSQVTAAQVVTSLITAYDLKRISPDREHWSNDQYSLDKDKYEDIYTLTVGMYDTNEKLPIVQKETALSAAREFISKTLPDTPLTSLESGLKYIDFNYEMKETTPAEATALQIPFSPIFQDYPVYYRNQSDYPFIVTIDGKNTVRRLEFFPQFQTYTQVDQRTPLTIEASIEQIKSGVASIIYSEYTTEPAKLSDLADAVLNSVSIEYREDSTQQLVIPFYRFSGTATTRNGVAVHIQLITPAIKTTPATGRN